VIVAGGVVSSARRFTHRSDRRIAPKVTVPLDLSKDRSQSRSRALVGTK